MNYLILKILVYFIIIQALFLSFHFFTVKKPNLKSNKILAYLLLCFAIAVFSFRIILDTPGMDTALRKIFYILHLVLNLLTYFLLLLYIQSLYSGKLKIRFKNQVPHIVLIFVYLIYCLIIIDYIPTLQTQEGIKVYFRVSTVKVTIYLIYLILIFSSMKTEFGSFRAFFSIRRNPNSLWLSLLTGSFIFLWLMEVLIFFVIVFRIVDVMFGFIVVGAIIAPFIFINAVMIMALKKPLVFYIYQAGNSLIIKDEDQIKYVAAFEVLMENEMLYKEAGLSLQKVSGLLKINPKYLSYILNKHFGGGFPEIVNRYRIENCMKMLDNESGMNIQQIMYEAGFNSKSAFLKNFKKITGCTPSEYKLRNQKG